MKMPSMYHALSLEIDENEKGATGFSHRSDLQLKLTLKLTLKKI